MKAHREEFIVLADVNHNSALIGWGAFFFERDKHGRIDGKPIDDDDLKKQGIPREDSIGFVSKSYGPASVFYRPHGSNDPHAEAKALLGRNCCLIEGLAPDTSYEYYVEVRAQRWADGPRKDWDPARKKIDDGGVYANVFRTHPHPGAPLDSVKFAVIGDFGTGVSKEGNEQRMIAERLTMEADLRFIVTTGDNIYARRKFGIVKSTDGDEDDDWYFTYFQAYRYLLNRIPVYASMGNHDTESEGRDDRDGVVDNLFFEPRLITLNRPHVLDDNALMYVVDYGADVRLVALDSSYVDDEKKARSYHFDREFIDRAMAVPPRSKWLIPFFHHPPFCGGPSHFSDADVQKVLVPAFDSAQVQLVLTGHEHNAQLWRRNRCAYVVTGAAGGKLRTGEIETELKSLEAGPPAPSREYAAAAHHCLIVTLNRESGTAEFKGVDGAVLHRASLTK